MVTGERGERALILTYGAGRRSGIFRFLSGGLVAIERVPESLAPPHRTGAGRKT